MLFSVEHFSSMGRPDYSRGLMMSYAHYLTCGGKSARSGCYWITVSTTLPCILLIPFPLE